MMIKNMVVKKVVVKKFKAFALLLIIIFSVSAKGQSRRNKMMTGISKQQIQSSQKDAPKQIIGAYNSIVTRYELNSKKGKEDFNSKITEADRSRLEMLYKKMSKKQQADQLVGFRPNIPPPPQISPTDKQLEDWENGSVYRVWIDGQKVANSILRNYSKTDFIGASVNRLFHNKANDKYSYKVELMTKDYYEQYYREAPADKNKTIMFVRTIDKS
ncbi:MAG: hypothetical protein M3040_15800 [Bacteroidota bacterium]|nr:hypothetical protein [Bacteroidota bacterium]